MKVGYLWALGNIWEIKTNNSKLVSIKVVDKELTTDKDPYLEKCKKQLQEYFNGSREKFSLEYELIGTDFQKKVWEVLPNISYGRTVTYLDIARYIGNPKGVRAVGQAVGKNPLAIVLPCHRVIGKSKKLVGYAYGLDLKERLLKFEQENRFIKDSRSR